MSDQTGPRGPSPMSQSTTGAAPGAPSEPWLPAHAAPTDGTPPTGIRPAGLPPSGHADYPPPMTAEAEGASRTASPAQDAGARLRDKADEVKDQGAEVVDTLKQEGGAVLDAAQQRASGFLEEQKRAGADQAEGLARAVHGAADQLRETSPEMAEYVHQAAASVDRMARTLRDRGPGQLLHDVQDLARQQPVAFFGAAVLAGFAIARFARASAPAGASSGAHAGMGTGQRMDGGIDHPVNDDHGIPAGRDQGGPASIDAGTWPARQGGFG